MNVLQNLNLEPYDENDYFSQFDINPSIDGIIFKNQVEIPENTDVLYNFQKLADNGRIKCKTNGKEIPLNNNPIIPLFLLKDLEIMIHGYSFDVVKLKTTTMYKLREEYTHYFLNTQCCCKIL